MTLLAGVLPVLRGLGADLSATLARAIRGTAATSTGRRLRQASIVAQLALSFALLVSAALVIQTFVRLRAVDPGFDAAGRMTLSRARRRRRDLRTYQRRPARVGVAGPRREVGHAAIRPDGGLRPPEAPRGVHARGGTGFTSSWRA